MRSRPTPGLAAPFLNWVCFILLLNFFSLPVIKALEGQEWEVLPEAEPQVQFPPGQPGTNQIQPIPLPTQEGKSCLHTFECDAGNTVLSCERGKCTCPMRPQIQWTRGPHPLNTVWDLNLRKCLSVKDSACDVFNPKVVYCSQGLVCKPGSAKDGFGICVNGGFRLNSLSNYVLLFATTFVIAFKQYLQ